MGGAAFGGELRRLRRERRWTQEDLAFHAGIDQTSVSQYERGKHLPTMEMIGRLARAFGMAPEDLARLAGHLPMSPDADQSRTAPPPAIEDVMQRIQRRPELMAKLERLRRDQTPSTYERIVTALAEVWETQIDGWDIVLTVNKDEPDAGEAGGTK